MFCLSCFLPLWPSVAVIYLLGDRSFSRYYRIIRNPPPHLGSTPPHISTTGDIVFGSFFDGHFITEGTMNTTPHTEVRLKTASPTHHATSRISFAHNTHRHGHHHWREVLCSIKVNRTSLRTRSHRCLLLPRPEHGPRRLFPGSTRLRCRYHVCCYSCCCVSSLVNRCRHQQ